MLAALLVVALVFASSPVQAGELTPLALVGETGAEEHPAATKPARSAAVDPTQSQGPRRTLTITLGGDLGLNPHASPVEAEGARRHGRFLAWDELTSGIRPLLDGDLNFANLETVVTVRNDLAPEAKAFNFRSHPAGVRHLGAIGFNLLSTANNHAIDYGVTGLRETIANLDALVAERRILAHAGIAPTQDAASRPSQMVVRGVRVAFSAFGIDSGARAGDGRPGMMAWRVPQDVDEVIRRLGEAPADYRILSVHHGKERDVSIAADAIGKLRQQAVLGSGIDLVAGHHAHVVQGIEMADGRLIFYGLGNLLHPGMQDMSVFGMCQDYGLLARVHLSGNKDGRLAVRAVEVVPLEGMHWQARPMAPGAAADRVHVLNHLADALDDGSSRARGLRFAPQSGHGSGLYCAPGADREPGRVGQLCRGWSGVPPTPPALEARIASACARRPVLRSAPRYVSTATRGAALSAAPSAPQRDPGWVRNVFAGN